MFSRLSTKQIPDALPADLHRAIVESLFQDKRSMLVGIIALGVSAAVCYHESGEISQAIFSVLFFLVGLLRYSNAARFERDADLVSTPAGVRIWETRYFIGTTIFAIMLGSWGFASFLLSDNQTTHLISAVTILGCIIGVYGRNFALRRLVDTQIYLIGIPFVLGFVVTWNPYYFYIALGLVPFLTSLRKMAARQRNGLLNALVSQKETAKIAEEFDAAITNMPVGLCMFSADGRLVVSNPMMGKLFADFEDRKRQDISGYMILKKCLQAECRSPSDVKQALNSFRAMRKKSTGGKMTVALRGDRTYEIDYQPKADGGAVVLFTDMSERVIADRKIKYMARHDSLTGLANRAYFLQRVEQSLAEREGSGLSAVMVLDLDRFKQINDTLGHLIGDKVLQEVSHKLEAIIGDQGILCRFGGDEFVVMLPNIQNERHAEAIAARIVREISIPGRIDKHYVETSVSIGIALAGAPPFDPAKLIQNADLALYRAKSNPDRQISFFEQEMEDSFHTRLRLENELRKAVKERSLTVSYQPVIDTASNSIVACEALVRWHHPEMGNISPAVFIPVAESTGLINDLGNFVLETACEQCMTWPEGVSVAVNLSAVQLHRHDVTSAVMETLKKTGLPAERLELEITETAVLQDLETTCQILEELQGLGAKIALDDFGTGYSSLSYLNSLPIDKLKVDRSFISQIVGNTDALILVRGITRTAQELGLTVVLEGIETNEQLNVIAAELPGTLAQGFLFGRPLPDVVVGELLATHWKRKSGGKSSTKLATAS